LKNTTSKGANFAKACEFKAKIHIYICRSKLLAMSASISLGSVNVQLECGEKISKLEYQHRPASHIQVYHEFNECWEQAFLLMFMEFHQVDKMVAHAWSILQNWIYYQQLELQFLHGREVVMPALAMLTICCSINSRIAVIILKNVIIFYIGIIVGNWLPLITNHSNTWHWNYLPSVVRFILHYQTLRVLTLM
jgi:hypothetical protein